MAYITSATTKGGRNGRSMLDSGGMALAMALPKELGGAGDGHNPEQLFALGYSACFGQAILVLAKKHGIDGQAAKVTSDVTLNTDTTLSVGLPLSSASTHSPTSFFMRSSPSLFAGSFLSSAFTLKAKAKTATAPISNKRIMIGSRK